MEPRFVTGNRNPDGFIKQLGVVGQGQKSESGELEFVGAAMDVTAAKEAEERIRQSERELRIPLEAIPTSVLRTLPDGAVDFVNQSWLDYLGCSREEILDWGWMKTVHPEDVDKLLNNWEEALAAGEPLEIEARFRRADGKYRWFLNRTVPLRDGKGNIAKWYATIHDIEDSKQAEEQLRRSEHYLIDAQRLRPRGIWARKSLSSSAEYRYLGKRRRAEKTNRPNAEHDRTLVESAKRGFVVVRRSERFGHFAGRG